MKRLTLQEPELGFFIIYVRYKFNQSIFRIVLVRIQIQKLSFAIMSEKAKTMMASPSLAKDLSYVDYTSLFPPNHIGSICRFQILLCSLAIFVEVVWLIIATSFPGTITHDVNLTGIGIWSGLFGIVLATFGLWIRRNPSKCNIFSLMALSGLSGLFYMGYLSLAVVKATMIHRTIPYQRDLLTTMLVAHFIIGVLQETLLITLIIYAVKATCFQQTPVGTAYFLKSTIDDNGDEVFHLVPSNMGIDNFPSQGKSKEQLKEPTNDKTRNVVNELEMNWNGMNTLDMSILDQSLVILNGDDKA